MSISFFLRPFFTLCHDQVMAFYDKADSWWGEPRIYVRPTPCTDDRQKELTIPLRFVRQGGDNSLRFVQHVIQQLYAEDGQLVDAQSNTLDLSQEPDAWPNVEYRFVPVNTDIDSFSPVRGPESKSPFPRPAPTQSESTYSDSKRTSSRSGQVRFLCCRIAKQSFWPRVSSKSKFRSSLLARDGRCLLTQAERSMCTSAHIVPVTRLDVSGKMRSDCVGMQRLITSSFNPIDRFTACFSVFSQKDNSIPRLWAFWFETICTDHMIDMNGAGIVKWVKKAYRSYVCFGDESVADTSSLI